MRRLMRPRDLDWKKDTLCPHLTALNAEDVGCIYTGFSSRSWHVNAGLTVILTGEREYGRVTRAMEGAASCDP
jgi:hypothetical protein